MARKKEINLVATRSHFLVKNLLINDINDIKSLKMEFYNNFNYFLEILIKKINPLTINCDSMTPISTKNMVKLINKNLLTESDKFISFKNFFLNKYKPMNQKEFDFFVKNVELSEEYDKTNRFYIDSFIHNGKPDIDFLNKVKLNEINVLSLNLSLKEIRNVFKDKDDFSILSFLSFQNSLHIPKELLTYNLLYRLNNFILTKIFNKYEIDDLEIKTFLTNNQNGTKKLPKDLLEILYKKTAKPENYDLFKDLIPEKFFMEKDKNFYINEFKEYDENNNSIKYKKYYKELLLENEFIDLDFIEKFKDKINFRELSKNRYLSKEIIIKYFKLFHLDTLLKYQKFDEEFLKNLIINNNINYSKEIFTLNSYHNFHIEKITDKINLNNKMVVESFLKSQQLDEYDLNKILINNNKLLPIILKHQKNIQKLIDFNINDFTKEDKDNIFNNVHYFNNCKEEDYKKHFDNLLNSNIYLDFSILYDLSLIKLCRDFNLDFNFKNIITKNYLNNSDMEIKKTYFFNKETNLIIDNNLINLKRKETQQKYQDFGISLS